MIYVDGSGWNGNSCAICVLTEKKKYLKVYYSEKTNNECEYLAMLEGLKRAKIGEIIYTDSKLVEGQIMKGWKCNFENLREMRDDALKLVARKELKIYWCPRSYNKAGWILEARLEKIKADIRTTVAPRARRRVWNY